MTAIDQTCDSCGIEGSLQVIVRGGIPWHVCADCAQTLELRKSQGNPQEFTLAGSSQSNRGMSFQKVARESAKTADQRNRGLCLDETTAPFRGRVGPNGEAKGRILGSGQLDLTGYYRPTGQRWAIYTCLDAKTTAVLTRFDLSLLDPRQVKRVERVHGSGGIGAFLIERRSTPPDYRLLDWPTLEPWWRGYERKVAGRNGGGASSIPWPVIEAQCIAVPARKRGTAVRLDIVGALNLHLARLAS